MIGDIIMDISEQLDNLTFMTEQFGDFSIVSNGLSVDIDSLAEKILPMRNLVITYIKPHKDVLKSMQKAKGSREESGEDTFTNPKLIKNIDTIIDKIEENAEIKEHSYISTIDISIESYLGGLDTKDIYIRNKIYDFWSKVSKKKEALDTAYTEMKKAIGPIIEELLEEIEEKKAKTKNQLTGDWPKPTQSKGPIPQTAQENEIRVSKIWFESIEKLNKAYKELDQWIEPPPYIFEIDRVEIEEVEIAGRFFNYYMDLFTVFNIFKDIGAAKDTSNEDTEGGERGGDVNAQIQIEQILSESKTPEERAFQNTMFDPKLSDSVEDDELKSFVKNLEMLDPLLAQFMALNKGTLVAISDKGYNELLFKLDDWLEAAQIRTDDKGTRKKIILDDRIRQDVEDIRDSISVEMGRSGSEYWLPYTIAYDLEAASHNGKELNTDNVENEVELFLKKIANFLSEEHFRFPTAPDKLQRSGIGSNMEELFYPKTIQEARLRGSVPSRFTSISGKGDPKKITEYAKRITEQVRGFLEALNEYYFAPLHTGMVTGKIPKYITQKATKEIMAISDNFEVEVLMGKVYQQMLSTKINVGGEELKAIYSFLKAVTSKGITEIDESLTKMGEKASSALTDMFGWKDRNDEHIGAIIHYIISEQNSESKLLTALNIHGKTLEKLDEAFHTSNSEYPLFALPYYLEKNIGLYHEELDAETKTQSTNLRNLLINMKDMPILLKQLLKAHDEIRKIMGKEVNFAMRPMTIDNYEDVITKIYTNHNVDLAHLEVENIVQEVDSFSNIAKCYGITEEIVYQVKSEFR
mgnify:CR=1 FL=1